MVKKRTGGSALSQVLQTNDSECPKVENISKFKSFFEVTQNLINSKKILSCHDKSDGGLITALLESSFAGHIGVDIFYNQDISKINQFMFNEELGVVMQISNKFLAEVQKLYSEIGIDTHEIAKTNSTYDLNIYANNNLIYNNSLENLHKIWHRTSYEIQRIRDNSFTSNDEYNRIGKFENKGLYIDKKFSDPDLIKYFQYLNPNQK